MTPEQAKAALDKIRALVATDDDGPECLQQMPRARAQCQELYAQP